MLIPGHNFLLYLNPMIPGKRLQILLLCTLFTSMLYGQDMAAIRHNRPLADTGKYASNENFNNANKPLTPAQFLIPAIAIAYGFTSLNNGELKAFNKEMKDELYLESPHAKFGIDNYLQFMPAAMVYGVNMAGVKGKHNFADRTILYGISNILLSVTVSSLKKITAEQRPDGSASSSFPSGHTAEAFASAEFLRQEFKDVSPWYGVAGYVMAATTGFFRMYNNKHWLGDVVAGAGVGIASTKISYWLYPKLQQMILKKETGNTRVMPFYQHGNMGIIAVKKI
jgi:membrane-associated phospholipid phosphatase